MEVKIAFFWILFDAHLLKTCRMFAALKLSEYLGITITGLESEIPSESFFGK